MGQSFNAFIENSIKEHWKLDALTDYNEATLQYRDVARKIEKLHILFEAAGIVKGDKIAICGRNSSNWGAAFLATLTCGVVAVPILNEFKPENIHNLVNHSDARLLLVGDMVWPELNEKEMPHLEGIILLKDFSLLVSRTKELTYAREHLNEMFGIKFPKDFRMEHIHYHQDQPDELALINYTSGTTSHPKGVMIPYKALFANIEFAYDVLKLQATDKIVSILPLAHMYGLSFEFLYEFTVGCHIHFLPYNAGPKVMLKAFAELKPHIIIAVPLLVEKVIKKVILPKLQTPTMKILLKVPVINDKIKTYVREEMFKAFGGNLYELVIGGASFNQDVENFLRMIDFPYTVGYGMTECAPIICYEDWKNFALGSCGKGVRQLEVKIASSEPEHIVGEIICRGNNTMLGYYKNPEATREVLDEEGWLHTGDLGIMDAEGNIYIKGRSKNMLLGPSGHNIYPEEIEEKLNGFPYVSESIVIQKDDRLVALVHPDMDEITAQGYDDQAIDQIMKDNLLALNPLLPFYSQVSNIKVYKEEFEKTPKKSIKRFMYEDA